jgi:CubicO group peptidase (beta-lactamase class C family)
MLYSSLRSIVCKLIFTFIVWILGLLSGIAQSKPLITQVENSLSLPVPVKGFSDWNIIDRMKYYRVPGVSIAVINNYKIDFAKSYGLADTSTKRPATNSTIYSAGSISKLVTAVIVMRLVDEGKLHLDSPVNSYLKTWQIPQNNFTANTPITLRMLLSHTAGTSQSAYWGFEQDEANLPSVVEILSGHKKAQSNSVVVNSEPKKEWRYSGGGYMIVQLVLMDVLQQSFESIAEKYVFQPLEMLHSTFVQPLPPRFKSRFSMGYSAASWYKGTPFIYPQQAAAGLHCTATDLAKLIIAIQQSLDGRSSFLSMKSATELVTPQVSISKGNYNEEMGVGAFLLERNGNTRKEGKYFEHQGANAGFISYAMGSVTNGKGVVILMNTGDDYNGFGKELRRSVAKVYQWENFLLDEVKPITLPKAVLQEYVGRYRKGADEVVYTRQQGNYLVEKINNGNDIYCFFTKKDSIVFTDFAIKGFFDRDSTGAIGGLRTEYDTKENHWRKMAADEFTATEYLQLKNYAKAKEAFKELHLNEYAISYIAYEWLNKKPFNSLACKTLLELAKEQHPNSSVVFARWGDYFIKMNDKPNAIIHYKKAVALDPVNNEAIVEELKKLNP